jgi:outer membrane protein
MCRSWLVSVAIAVVLLVPGCTPVPRVGGVPVAPAGPDAVWHPPRAAVARDSVGEPVLPKELAAHADSLTLPEMVSLALRNNPATRASWAQAQMAADAYGAARAGFFPMIDAGINAGRLGSRASSSRTGNAAFQSTITPSVTLSYTVLDFGAEKARALSARETAFALSFTHNATIQSTVFGVEQAYYMYAMARAVLGAQQLSLREAQVSYQAASKRDSVGMATLADVMQARTAVAQAQLALDTAEVVVETTHARLAVAFGARPTAPYDVTKCLEDVDVTTVAASVESLVNEAIRQRPDVQAARANIRAAEAAVTAARSALRPTLNLSATYGYLGGYQQTVATRDYTVSLGLSFPVFHGLGDRYEISRAKAATESEIASAATLEQTVALDVVVAYHQLRGATDVVVTSESLLASTTAAMDVARARYGAGLGTILDLLTAQTSLASARAQQARARWSWAQQLAMLAVAVGALDERGTISLPTAPR